MVSCGDRLGKMPKSKSGNSNILSLVDYFTKWPDQGREFVNSVMSSLIEKTNAVHRISTAYHPQTNGLVERFKSDDTANDTKNL